MTIKVVSISDVPKSKTPIELRYNAWPVHVVVLQSGICSIQSHSFSKLFKLISPKSALGIAVFKISYIISREYKKSSFSFFRNIRFMQFVVQVGN